VHRGAPQPGPASEHHISLPETRFLTSRDLVSGRLVDCDSVPGQSNSAGGFSVARQLAGMAHGSARSPSCATKGSEWHCDTEPVIVCVTERRFARYPIGLPDVRQRKNLAGSRKGKLAARPTLYELRTHADR
jgi:hypothetical protein